MPNYLPKLTRRRFLAGGVAAIGAPLLYTWRVEPHWAEFVARVLPIENLPRELDGQTLVQLSDLHVGQRVDSSYLISMMQRVSDLQPAITVITGDFMSCSQNEQQDQVVQVMQHLKPARWGTYAILGNHDYGSSWQQYHVADELVARLNELKITTLRNHMTTVQGLQLVGLDDLWSHRFDPSQVLPQVDWQQPALTLCHNPDAVDLTSMAPIRGWVLSGHTHGGQCKPPFLPPPILPVKNLRYTAGEFVLDQQRSLYINRGLGYNIRVRFNVRPEVTIFHLQRVEVN